MATAREIAGGSAAQASNVLKEAVNRIPGILDLVSTLVGIQLNKKLKLRVVVLRDETGNALAQKSEIMPSFAEAQRIFFREARVRLVPAAPLVTTVSEPSPTAALDVHCDDGAWQEDFATAGAYFRQHEASTSAGKWTGYGAPVTVFIVRNISNKGGCSLGPLSNYVTLEAKMLDRARYRLLAHEVAHACGLWHSKVKAHLMYPRGPGDQFTSLHLAVLRSSRHVTYL